MVSLDSTAYLIGKIMGDGHLEKNLGSCYFSSGDFTSLSLLREFIATEFGIDVQRTIIKQQVTERGRSYKLRIHSTKFSRFLFSKGAPRGKKVEQPFFIPSWIYEQREYQRKFLQAILEDELTTIKIEKGSHSVGIQFKMSKINEFIPQHYLFMKQIKSMLESFSIECGNLRLQENKEDLSRTRIYFAIQRNKENLIRFKEQVGFFLNLEKSKQLEYSYLIFKSTLRPKIDLNEIQKLRLKGLTIREIATKNKISHTHVHRLLQKMSLKN